MSENSLQSPVQKSSEWELGWELKAFNGKMRRWRRDRGLSQKRLGEIVGVSNVTINRIELMITRPSSDLRRRLAAFFCCNDQDIWPDWLEPRKQRMKAVAYQTVGEVQFSALEADLKSRIRALPAPDSTARDEAKETVQSALRQALSRIPSRERLIIETRYGLGEDPEPKTLEATGLLLNIGKERVRQLEARAIRKLQHPVRSGDLERAVDELRQTM